MSQAELRGLKVLSPHGVWVTEANGPCAVCVSACDCYNPGSQGDGISSCAARSGQCPCLPNVAGLKCDKCWDGYWNIDSGRGQYTPLKCHSCSAQYEYG